jgi:hypothetical protein
MPYAAPCRPAEAQDEAAVSKCAQPAPPSQRDPETVRRQIGAAEAADGKAVILKSAFGPFRATMRAHVQQT